MKSKRISTGIACIIILLGLTMITPSVYSQEEAFRFAVLADIQEEGYTKKGRISPGLEDISDKITESISPSFVISMGNMIGNYESQDPKPSTIDLDLGFRAVFKLRRVLNANNIGLMPIAGKYDVNPESAGERFKEKMEKYDFSITLDSKTKHQRQYSFEHKNSYFIMLYAPDSESISEEGEEDSVNRFNWLKDRISKAKKGNYEHIFVFGHTPIEHMATEAKLEKGKCTGKMVAGKELKEEAVDLLQDDRIVYFSGQDRIFHDGKAGNVHQVSSGYAAGNDYRCVKEEEKPQNNSFLVVDVNGKDITVYGLSSEYDYNKTFDGISLPESPGESRGSMAAKAQQMTQRLIERMKQRENLIGIYSLVPSFRTKIDYNMSDYDIIRDAVRGQEGLIQKIEDCESGGKDIQECIARAITTINKKKELIHRKLTFFDGPCDGEENIKSDLVEDYFACLESSDDDCICRITLKRDPKAEKNKVVMEVRKIEAEPTFGYVGEDTSDELNYLELWGIQAKTITGVSGKGTTAEEELRITMGKNEDKRDLLFYKSNDNMHYIKDGKQGNKEECSVNRRTFKFCVRKSNRQYWIMDDMTGETEKEYIQYKFALTFRDASPPRPVRSLCVADLPLSERKALVSWEESPEADIAGYTVLQARSNKTSVTYSPGEGAALRDDLPFEYVKADKRVNKEPILLKETEIITVEGGSMPSDCEYTGVQLRCYLGSELVNMSRGILYRLTDDNINVLAYIMETEDDDMDYDYSVVPFDTSGNELTILSPILRNKTSYDDLPPEILDETIARRVDAVNVSVTWERPQTDLDGSPIDDLKGFHIYYSPEITTVAEGLEHIKTIEVPADHKKGDFDFTYSTEAKIPSDGNIAVIPYDENSNEQKEGVLFTPIS